MHMVLYVIMNHVIVFHYVNIDLIIMHFAIKLIIIFLHVKNLCSDTFCSMLLKRKWIIEKTNYYRVKIRMTLENISEIYNICTDCPKHLGFYCSQSAVECMQINYEFSKNKMLYRYFPYAPKKKIYNT
jgi:hypothetical protein